MKTSLLKEAHLIKDRLAGGDDFYNKTDVRDIIQVYKGVMAEVLRLQFYDNMKEGDRSQIAMYISEWSGDAALTVQFDKKGTKQNYVILPDLYGGLPYNKSLVYAFPDGNPDTEIYRSNNPYVSKSLPVGNMEGRPSYYLQGFKMIFRENNWKDSWTKVGVHILIPAPENIGDSDDLPVIPTHLNEIRNRVTQYFLNMPVQDVLNDGNKDRGVKVPE